MNQEVEILSGPDYFYCERTRCRLSIKACLTRQSENTNKQAFGSEPLKICIGCDQGTKNKEMIKPENIESSQKPKRGKGQRNLDCKNYENCLDVAAHQAWESFHCESCTYYRTALKDKAGVEKMESKRICKTCNERETIQPKSPYCSACLAVMGKKAREAKQKAAGTPEKKKKAVNKVKTIKAPEKTSTAFMIEFGKYSSVLKEVKELAEIEIRPIDLQIIYMIKCQLEKIREDLK